MTSLLKDNGFNDDVGSSKASGQSFWMKIGKLFSFGVYRAIIVEVRDSIIPGHTLKSREPDITGRRSHSGLKTGDGPSLIFF